MFADIVGLLVLALLAALLGWLTRRAWGAKRGWVKWPGTVLAGLFTFLVAMLTVVSAVGTYKLSRSYHVPVPQVTVAGTPEQIARGEHLADVLCASCHSLNGEFPMTGGRNLGEETGLPLGDVYPPNITPAGDIAEMSDGELFRLIRTGVNEEGRGTAMTSIMGPRALSDEDTLAVIAFLRQSFPAEGETPPFKPSILLSLLMGAGLIPSDVPSTVGMVSTPPKAATAEYGEYVLAYMDCNVCHGPKLDGNVPPPAPTAPDIRTGLSNWTKEDFSTLVRAQASAAEPGHAMPWKYLARLDDVEFEALYLYLHEVANK